MKMMDNRPFELEQVYDAPIEEVWRILTDEDDMKEWYFPQLKKFKPVVSYKFDFTDDGSDYKKEWQVTKIDEGRKLGHSWIYKDYPGSSEVTFELFPVGNKTRLKLTHTGLASFPDDPHFARRRFEDGWKQIIGSNLKNYLKNQTS
ncbi:uncharacterized protein YndB with AHSA1/START domain [Mucilaginibacter sp. UYP25]|uniref:SRPBCC family protein n=1 Tax=unclassified Mucilaginibacter TaxID=2617802 RepID=UPI00339B1965